MDNAATAPIHPEVIDAMMPYLREQYGNPSSIHRQGRAARRAVERARRQVASLIGAKPSEIVFTSGGTESNNTILRAFGDGHVMISSAEHDSILEPCRATASRCTLLPVDAQCMVQPDTIRGIIEPDVSLVSVMTANNEVGTIQDIPALSAICHDVGVPFHTDMVQAAGKIPVDVHRWGVDAASISSHKLGGPKGVGALYIRKGLEVPPTIHGGGQEGGLRSGTENVAGIVGFGEACSISHMTLAQTSKRVSTIRDELMSRITSEIPHVVLNGHHTCRLPGNIHVAFLGVEGEDLIIKLDEHGIAASTGSACSVHTQKESHVLVAMGLSPDIIRGSLRLTLGYGSDPSDADLLMERLPCIVDELRAVSPFREKYGP